MRHMGDGSVTGVVAWSRSERWRFSRAARHLPRPSCPSPTTERCRCAIAVTHSRGSPAGARVLLEGAISGRTAGERSSWLVAFHNGSVRAGSPVVNGSGAPGPGRQPDSPVRVASCGDELRGTPLVSFADMKVPESAAAVPLDKLRLRGELLLRVLGEAHVVSGGFATAISRGPTVAPTEQRREFSTENALSHRASPRNPT